MALARHCTRAPGADGRGSRANSVMLPDMKAKPSVAIVGLGNLGTALALRLTEAGYAVTEIISRHSARRRHRTIAKQIGARLCGLDEPIAQAALVWICVSDSQIRSCAEALSVKGKWPGKIVFHSSGALSSDELVALRHKGARVASVHPMMTFVRGVQPSLRAVPFALEGESAALALARRVVRDLGGDPFILAKRNKPAYHAWGGFASPLLVAALVTGEQVAGLAGIRGKAARKKMLPIVRQTLENYAELGGAEAFSGPIIRGDVETVRKHLRVLSRLPYAKQVYAALARSALQNFPSRDPKALKRILG